MPHSSKMRRFKEKLFAKGILPDPVEICNECGKSVQIGSGNYVNRVIDLHSVKERITMGKPYPEGGFMCAECDQKLRA